MSDPLERFVLALEQLEHSSGLRLVVVGGVARGVWATPRATMDVDVLVDTDDASLIETYAPSAGLVAIPEEVASLRTSGMTRLRLHEVRFGWT